MYFEKISLFALSLLFSQPTFAQESIPLTFTPSAIITKNTINNDIIEFIAEKVNFKTVYSSDGAFHPVDIPFIIRSVKGTAITYSIEMPVSQHYCFDGSASGSPTELRGLSFTLDQKTILPKDESGSNSNIKYSVAAPLFSQHHNLRMNFPNMSAKAIEQNCYGFISLIATPVGSTL